MYKIEDNFEDSIADVFSHLGIERKHTREVLKIIGVRNHNDGHESALDARKEAYNTPELRQIVADLYADDIKLGDYAFDKADDEHIVNSEEESEKDDKGDAVAKQDRHN